MIGGEVLEQTEAEELRQSVCATCFALIYLCNEFYLLTEARDTRENTLYTHTTVKALGPQQSYFIRLRENILPDKNILQHLTSL